MEDVCWLLAYHEFHQNGDPDDAYNVFIALYSAGQLLPTDKDWEEVLAEEDDEFLDELRRAGERLLERARANPGHEEVETWHDGGHQVMCVDLLVEADGQAEVGWMGLTLPENEVLSDREVFDLVAQLLPPNVKPLYSLKFKDRDRRRGEIVYSWEWYSFHDKDDESNGTADAE